LCECNKGKWDEITLFQDKFGLKNFSFCLRRTFKTRPKLDDPENASKRYAKYVPFGA
jgi:hypothetical protein